jgi:hypothetical protein
MASERSPSRSTTFAVSLTRVCAFVDMTTVACDALPYESM